MQSVCISPEAPTAGGVVLRQQGPWTVGVLANHIWCFGGSSRADVNSNFVQPYLTCTTPTATTFVVNTGSAYDWEGRQWSVPVDAGVAQVLRLGEKLVQLGILGRCWAESPQQGPHGWGPRLDVVLLFPR